MTPPPVSTSRFGVDRAELAALAQSWRRSGRDLAGLDVDELIDTAEIMGCGDAVRAAADPVKRVGVDIANRLDILSQIVGRFSAAAAEDDDAAGRALAALPDR